MISGILSSGHDGTVDWNAAEAACQKAGSATPLLATQHASCLAVMDTLSYMFSFGKAEEKCTTGTGLAARAGEGKSSAQNTAALQPIICLEPEYQQLGRLAAAMYTQDRAARQQALARGFTGVCLATLVDTPSQLQAEQRLAIAAKGLATDAATVSGVVLHEVSPSKLNVARVDSDTKAFAAAFSAMTKLTGPIKLSVCAHQ